VENLRFGWIQNKTPGGAFTVNLSQSVTGHTKNFKNIKRRSVFFILNLEFGGDALIFVITVR